MGADEDRTETFSSVSGEASALMSRLAQVHLNPNFLQISLYIREFGVQPRVTE